MKKRRRKQKSNKGALIKGMSKALPIELLNDPAFEKGLNKGHQQLKELKGPGSIYLGINEGSQ
jgi:hypothetical protein